MLVGEADLVHKAALPLEDELVSAGKDVAQVLELTHGHTGAFISAVRVPSV